jgi:hypothetical protein
MKRQRQTFQKLVESLQVLSVDWMASPMAARVINLMKSLPTNRALTAEDVIELLTRDFDAGSTVIRLVFEMSQDEYDQAVPLLFSGKGAGKVTQFKADPHAYVDTLDQGLRVVERLNEEVHQSHQWQNRLVGRFQGGWGSAIKGQLRGKGLEDFVEEIARKIFRPDQVHMRCSFVGADGQTVAKADVAIPSATDPLIVIEVKAYGATGSKQSDVLGDAKSIIAAKRHDTVFLLVTDGITWKKRASDLNKLIQLQNTGKIHRIYTKSMADDLHSDLETLKSEFGL